ncbi:MAG: hypothetical protein HY000_14615 [Planctomycetes bacterium]|nr:hypothetical protein [Planctomycetota bacterium]
MDSFTRDDLRQLIAGPDAGPCVSIYFPTERTGFAVRQAPIRCKNLASQAEEQLISGGMRPAEARALLAPANTLCSDNFFWTHKSDGVVLFAAEGSFHAYRLPIAFEERVIVGERHFINPLLPLFQGGGHFFLLAASKQQARLYYGTRFGLSELETHRLPKTLATALVIDEKGPYHFLRTYGLFDDERDPSLFHGHGGSGREVQQRGELTEYFHRLDDALQEYLHNESSPLVFAGVDYLFPIFRESISYRAVVQTPVRGNPEHFAAERLHQEAWSLVEPLFLRGQHEARERYGEYAVRGRASDQLAAVLPAAHDGRVDTLFIAAGLRRLGTVDHTTGRLVKESQDEVAVDLVDYAVAHTLLNRGEVYAVKPAEMPAGDTVAATFRYALDWPSNEADQHERTMQALKAGP